MSDDSLTSNDSFLHSNLSSLHLPFSQCLLARPSAFIYFAYFMTNILLILPLSIFILYQGFERWQQQRSTAAESLMSHSDCFTYHVAAMELIGVVGLILCCCGVFTYHVETYWVGFCLYSLAWYGELFINTLTCVERFLAVIHPITYLSLRRERGVRIRNICMGCVWMFCFVEVGLLPLKRVAAKVDVFVLTTCLVIVLFCSLTVLCFLIRPGPGKQGGDREKVDQSKQRAFFTIVAILTVLSLRCVWNLTWASLFVSKARRCVIMACGTWFNLPTSLLLLILFLQREGILGSGRSTK